MVIWHNDEIYELDISTPTLATVYTHIYTHKHIVGIGTRKDDYALQICAFAQNGTDIILLGTY